MLQIPHCAETGVDFPNPAYPVLSTGRKSIFGKQKVIIYEVLRAEDKSVRHVSHAASEHLTLAELPSRLEDPLHLFRIEGARSFFARSPASVLLVEPLSELVFDDLHAGGGIVHAAEELFPQRLGGFFCSEGPGVFQFPATPRSTHPSPPTPTADPPVAEAPNTKPVACPNLKKHPPLNKVPVPLTGTGAEKPGKEAFPGLR